MSESMADNLLDLLGLALLLVGLVIGWLIGKSERRRQPTAPRNVLTREYFQGINLLLNEKRDEAVDVLLRTLEVNSETADTYLTMGSLFRQRGEVDRAVRIHQDLLARPNLSREQQTRVRMELARDYLKAGLLDRSERLLLELIEENSEESGTCLSYLLAIYEQEKEWPKAVETAERIIARGNEDLGSQLSHYLCEMIEDAMRLGDAIESRALIRRALSADRLCVRASLLEGRLEEKLGNTADAIKAYRRVRQQKPAFITETLEPLKRCHALLQEPQEYVRYLYGCLEEHPAASTVMALSEELRLLEGDAAGAFVLSEYLKKRPSVKGLHRLIDFHVANAQGAARENLGILKAFTTQLLSNKPVYRCSRCGYDGKSLMWRCPKCQQWGSLAPIVGLEGE